MARAGQAAARALAAAGGSESVRAWDGSDGERTRRARAALETLRVEVSLGGDGVELLDRAPAPRCVVKSPGLAPETPLLREAVRRDIVVVDELELGWRLDSRPVVGVTGTNGKSTVAELVRAVARADGARPILAGNTVFGPPLSAISDEEGDLVVAEVSSLQLETSPCFLADLAVVTNLTQDHLDRHGTLEAYGAAKRRIALRGREHAGTAVVGVDDDFGRELARDLRAAGAGVTTVGRGEEADVRLVECSAAAGGSALRTLVHGEPVELRTRLTGEHNALNALVAFAVVERLGVARETSARALASAAAPPGRLELVGGGEVKVVVDYAHNPDGIRQALRAARALCRRPGGRLIAVACALWVVVPEQRRAMGREAALGSDHLVLTLDRVDPAEPADRLPPGLEEGARGVTASVEVVCDRREAIRAAVDAAHPGDVVAILGRGNRSRGIGADGKPTELDDRKVAREVLGRG